MNRATPGTHFVGIPGGCHLHQAQDGNLVATRLLTLATAKTTQEHFAELGKIAFPGLVDRDADREKVGAHPVALLTGAATFGSQCGSLRCRHKLLLIAPHGSKGKSRLHNYFGRSFRVQNQELLLLLQHRAQDIHGRPGGCVFQPVADLVRTSDQRRSGVFGHLRDISEDTLLVGDNHVGESGF
ncbi:MAG: hypothetical protein DDT38_01595 [Firmicutes bacterium]|nr:hypothetical protein [candidate division NPL-UPA2 bacterium]